MHFTFLLILIHLYPFTSGRNLVKHDSNGESLIEGLSLNMSANKEPVLNFYTFGKNYSISIKPNYKSIFSSNFKTIDIENGDITFQNKMKQPRIHGSFYLVSNGYGSLHIEDKHGQLLVTGIVDDIVIIHDKQFHKAVRLANTKLPALPEPTEAGSDYTALQRKARSLSSNQMFAEGSSVKVELLVVIDDIVFKAPFDVAFMLTGYLNVLFESGEIDISPAGLANTGGLCQAYFEAEQVFSCGIAQDFYPLLYVDVITSAHEMAHILGAPHDGKEKAVKCGNLGYIMEEFTHNEENVWNFSPCSLDIMQKYINQRGQCLTTIDDVQKTPILDELPSDVSRDDYCKAWFGEEAKELIQMDICIQLVCLEGELQYSPGGMPEGTPS